MPQNDHPDELLRVANRDAADTIDVRRVVKLCESVGDAFRNYVDGTGLDAKQLAAEVPRLLESHVQLAALKRAGYGFEEINRLDAENKSLRAALDEACAIAEAAIPKMWPMDQEPAQLTQVITLDAGVLYRQRARIAELRARKWRLEEAVTNLKETP
jgi:hypothetical protein